MKIRITADSTCDLPPELIQQHNIQIVPLSIIKGDRSYLDGLEIVPQDIFDYVESGAGVCSTAAANLQQYVDVFQENLKTYDAVIHIGISSAFSTCVQNARIAAEEFENVYVVDSRNLSTGSGHLVLDAALMAEEGMEASEIAETIEKMTLRVEASFVLDTLKYLWKGGRCSGVTALGANILKLKPCIEVRGGKMEVGKKYRGNIDKVILQYVRDRLQGRDDIDQRRIFITCTTTSDAMRQAVEDEVRRLMHFDEIIHSRAGCTISNHCGPNTLGILFYRK